METLIHADIFFFISSIGFIVLFAFGVIFLFHLVRIAASLARITKKAEKDIAELGDTAKELVSDLRENALFSWLFGKK